MEQIVSAAVNELKEELTETVNATTEPSRFVRLMHLKYKCCVIFFLAIISSMLIGYITIKEVLRDEEAGVLMTQMFDLIRQTYFPNATATIDVVSALKQIKNK